MYAGTEGGKAFAGLDQRPGRKQMVGSLNRVLLNRTESRDIS